MSNLDFTDNKGVILDQYGDPIRRGTLMTERESYERIIEGHRLAADAARHLAKRERKAAWVTVANGLDEMRLHVMKLARIEDAGFRPTTDSSGSGGLGWRNARDRFREGLRQAAGGCRQMATCHRGVLDWSRIAAKLEGWEGALLKSRPRINSATAVAGNA